MRLIESPGGVVSGQKLCLRTGLFGPATPEDIDKVLKAGSGMGFVELSEEEFIRETEDARSCYLRGYGPIFDIYREIDAVYDEAKQSGRKLDSVARDRVLSLCRRAFDMWEVDAARRAAGYPPSFEYEPVGA
ncbi:hypothetical protein [Nocardia violaceofusca]|uniref:hypothetical protein n=1 Tax=Nocardia violaceofusca TaxID=941182 RepID=UPI0007A45D4C|nr:hypothetical protein [Nocardia violaceofusca]